MKKLLVGKTNPFHVIEQVLGGMLSLTVHFVDTVNIKDDTERCSLQAIPLVLTLRPNSMRVFGVCILGYACAKQPRGDP